MFTLDINKDNLIRAIRHMMYCIEPSQLMLFIDSNYSEVVSVEECLVSAFAQMSEGLGNHMKSQPVFDKEYGYYIDLLDESKVHPS